MSAPITKIVDDRRRTRSLVAIPVPDEEHRRSVGGGENDEPKGCNLNNTQAEDARNVAIFIDIMVFNFQPSDTSGNVGMVDGVWSGDRCWASRQTLPGWLTNAYEGACRNLY